MTEVWSEASSEEEPKTELDRIHGAFLHVAADIARYETDMPQDELATRRESVRAGLTRAAELSASLADDIKKVLDTAQPTSEAEEISPLAILGRLNEPEPHFLLSPPPRRGWSTTRAIAPERSPREQWEIRPGPLGQMTPSKQSSTSPPSSSKSQPSEDSSKVRKTIKKYPKKSVTPPSSGQELTKIPPVIVEPKLIERIDVEPSVDTDNSFGEHDSQSPRLPDISALPLDKGEAIEHDEMALPNDNPHRTTPPPEITLRTPPTSGPLDYKLQAAGINPKRPRLPGGGFAPQGKAHGHEPTFDELVLQLDQEAAEEATDKDQ